MDLHICKDIKTVFITYPKCGSNSCHYALTHEFGNNFTKIVAQSTSDVVDEFHNIVPEGYDVHAFIRDPVERWISGFVFLLQTSYNLFYSDISNVKENIAEADDQWYMNYFNSIITLNNYDCTLNDSHMARWIYPLFLLQTVTPKMVLHDVYNMDKVLSKAYQTEDKELEKLNSAEAGYSPGFAHSDNQEHIPTIKKRFENLLTGKLEASWQPGVRKDDSAINAVRAYLDVEKSLYRRKNDINKNPELFLENKFEYIAEWNRSELKQYDNPSIDQYAVFTKDVTNKIVNSRTSKMRDILISNAWRFAIK